MIFTHNFTCARILRVYKLLHPNYCHLKQCRGTGMKNSAWTFKRLTLMAWEKQELLKIGNTLLICIFYSFHDKLRILGPGLLSSACRPRWDLATYERTPVLCCTVHYCAIIKDYDFFKAYKSSSSLSIIVTCSSRSVQSQVMHFTLVALWVAMIITRHHPGRWSLYSFDSRNEVTFFFFFWKLIKLWFPLLFSTETSFSQPQFWQIIKQVNGVGNYVL